MNRKDHPDVGQLASAELPRGSFRGGRGQAFRVFVSPSAHQQIVKHCTEDVAVEICGVLVGQWGRDDDGPFLDISNSIRGEAAQNKFAEVTFTHATWASIHRQMDAQFADQAIVGWYHTHPNFGVFLSDRDRFIQEHFFSNPGQVAYVIDPVRKIEGIFIWKNGKPALCPHYWIGDRVQVAPGDPAAETPAADEKPDASTPPRSGQGRAAEPSPLSSTTRLLSYLGLFLLGYLLAGMRNSWEQNRLVEGTVAYYGIWKGLRPGLEGAVGALNDHLSAMERHADRLVETAPQGQSDAQKQQWKDLRDRLAESQRVLGFIRSNYCLAPEEARAVEAIIVDKLKELHEIEKRAGAGEKAAAEPAAGTAKPAAAAAKPAAAAAKPAAAAPKDASGSGKK